MMKIAIPTRNGQVDEHFGHCDHYTIYTISEKQEIESEEKFEAPVGCGCKSNIAGILKNKGVEIMLAGNIGQGAVHKISEAGIRVYRGCNGDVRELTKSFLMNEVTDSGEVCSHHHDDEHTCNH